MTLTSAGSLTGQSFQAFLEELHRKYQPLTDGAIANYIPELAKADPDCFGICVVTKDGHVYEVGNTQTLFTIQSISKVFVYGMALQDHGRDYLLTRVGVEPTGDAFNAIILDEQSKRPYNPMVNAGAIAVTSLIKGTGPTERLNRMLDMFRDFIGHDIFVDVSVFMSERTTGHRNRAMAHLMRNFGMIDDRIDEALDLYFQQCSVTVDCRDLAVMAATIANHGINPITHTQALDSGYIRDLLSVMYTCGMYNFAGQWSHEVGLPAKSGVSGGIMVVVPNQFGLAVFSPPLDARGNSVRGIEVCKEISNHYGLHLFDSSMNCTRFVQQLGTKPHGIDGNSNGDGKGIGTLSD
ncbi:glutaminase A [Leptolyngbya sp. AN02str]|uniref:glutaminase A n=1 Tax=Leptolyngbya sp. AN02str TaxID=3423363 RepID=UPI003D319E2C